MNITVSGYNRPEYLEQTLAALRQCHGIDQCKVVVILDPCEQTELQQAMAERYGFTTGNLSSHHGCNGTIWASFAYGFEVMGSEFHVHFEDDTVPTRDCLQWFAWARDHYRNYPEVMNVSGYQRIAKGDAWHCGVRRWFTPWGWGTWRDRWVGMSPVLALMQKEKMSWDVAMNHMIRAGRYEAFPLVSRVQNIGAEKGVHVPSAEWHRANHHVEVTAGESNVLQWTEVVRDDRADHA